MCSLQEFKQSDNQIREVLPPLVAAAFSLLPHIMSVQIMIQNTLLAQYYTALHNFCEEVGFPSPAPPMDQVISVWERDFKPAQRSIESINCIARGKAVHQPMSAGDDRRSSSSTGLGIRNAAISRRPSGQNALPPAAPSSNFAAEAQTARQKRIPSTNSIPVVSPPSPAPTPSPEPTPPPFLSPDYSSHLTPQSSYSAFSPAGPSVDYFQRSSNSGASSPAGTKKKPPPPPPPKRLGSTQQPVLWAVALYGFEGQGEGDLSFKEGDRIKVIKKTESMDDWWDGELRGVKGVFPANYCKLS